MIAKIKLAISTTITTAVLITIHKTVWVKEYQYKFYGQLNPHHHFMKSMISIEKYFSRQVVKNQPPHTLNIRT